MARLLTYHSSSESGGEATFLVSSDNTVAAAFKDLGRWLGLYKGEVRMSKEQIEEAFKELGGEEQRSKRKEIDAAPERGATYDQQVMLRDWLISKKDLKALRLRWFDQVNRQLLEYGMAIDSMARAKAKLGQAPQPT